MSRKEHIRLTPEQKITAAFLRNVKLNKVEDIATAMGVTMGAVSRAVASINVAVGLPVETRGSST